MKKIFLMMTLFAASASAQNAVQKLTEAVNFYNERNYGVAHKLFGELIHENTLEEKNLVSAKYHSADCLLNLNQLDGAAIEFEDLIEHNNFSNFREPALYKLGMIYFYKGEYRKSRERLSSFISGYSLSEMLGSAYYWLGRSYFAENKFIEAGESFNNSIEKKQTNEFLVNSIYFLGLVHETGKDYKNAVRDYDELLAYYKDDPLAPKSQMRIGICYFNLNDYDNAILELSDPLLQKLDEKDLTDARMILATSYVRLKEYTNAARVYSELLAVQHDPAMSNRIKFSLAWIYFQQGGYDDAYKIFKELSALPADSLKIESLFWSGESKRYSGDVKSAGAIFTEFIEKYPGHPLAAKAQLGIGSVFFDQSNTADAEKALINATISDDRSTRGRAYTLLGEMRLDKKLFDDAGKYFSEALKLTPKASELNNRASLGFAVSEFYLNHYSSAISLLEELKESSKNFEVDKTNFYLAEAYFSKEQYSASLKNYNSIKSSSESIIRQTVLGKAYCYFNLKDFPNAIYYFNEYLSRYKTDPSANEIRLRLAESYFGNKNFEKASGIYSELFSKENFTLDNDLAYYQYGQSLFKSGKSEEAIKAFKILQEK
ncbi:MAG: tetratricopeptide repeat protein, partial [Melioribacteraceae bacterium]